MKKLIGVVAIAAMGFGCAAPAATQQEPVEVESTSGPLARVVLDGHVIEMFEIEPGVVVSREIAPANTWLVLSKPELRNLAPLELFHALAPDTEAPSSLREAAARWQTAHAEAPPKDPVGKTSSAISVETSGTRVGCPTDFGVDYDTRTTSFMWSKTWSDQRSIGSFVCNYGGNGGVVHMAFKYRRWWDWTSIKTDVPSGYYVYWYADDNLMDFDVQVSIVNPSLNTVRIRTLTW